MLGDGIPRIRRAAWGLLRFITPRFITRGYDYSCESMEAEGPCLIVSNHVTNLDPFFVGLALGKDPPAYVASEHIMRLGLVSKLIDKLVAPIPRSKAASGAGTVKACLRRLRGGESVVLFAEGDCTWDGLTHGVFPATGKLAKASGKPLVTFRIEGGYLSRPRWSRSLRRVHMHGGQVGFYSAERLAGMSADEVTAAINADIFEDAWTRQRAERRLIPSDRRAEGLERALAVCPKCFGLGTLASKDNTVFCKECGANSLVDELGFFEKGSYFSTVAEWDAWQKEKLYELALSGGAKAAPVFEGKFTRLSDGNGGRERSEKTRLALDPGLAYVEAGGRRFPFDETDDMSMVKTNRLLFSADGGYYEFKSNNAALRLVLLAYGAHRAAAGSREEKR